MNKSRLDLLPGNTIIISNMNNKTRLSEYILTTLFNQVTASFLLVVMLILLSSNALANQIHFNTGGSLNGQAVNAAGTEIIVHRGVLISGTLNLKVLNSHSSNGTFPVGATVTWGDRATQARELIPHVNNFPDVPLAPGEVFTGNSFANVQFSEIAPTVAGMYHIVLGARGECGYDHVMSATNWKLPTSPNTCGSTEALPVWNDGNDLGWDWTPAQFTQAETTGQVIQQLLLKNSDTGNVVGGVYDDGVYLGNVTYGANWIAVKVVPVPAATWLFGSGLLGVITVARRKKQ